MFKERVTSNFKVLVRGAKTLQAQAPLLWITILLDGACSVAQPFLTFLMTSRIIDGLMAKASKEAIMALVLWTLALNFVLTIALRGLRLWKKQGYEILQSNGNQSLNEKIANLDYAQVEDPATHELRTKIELYSNMNGSALVKMAAAAHFLITSIFTVIVALALMPSLFSFGPGPGGLQSALLTLGFGVVIILTMVAGSTWQMHLSRKLYDQYGEIMGANRVYGFYQDHVSNYNAGKGIRLYRQQPILMDWFEDFITNTLLKIIATMSRATAQYAFLITLARSLATCAIYGFVAYKALTKSISIGEVVLYIGAISRLVESAQECIASTMELMVNNQYVKDYFTFLDLPSTLSRGTIPVEKRDDDAYQFAFHQVSFKYPGTEKYVLKDLTLSMNMGERLAIVGMNGSGKTTMIKLLCRLYDPTEGMITLNGIDIRKYDYEEYLALFSVVFQDFKLFSFTVAQNISTHVAYDPPRVLEILKEVGLDQRFTRAERGLDTYLYKDFDSSGEEISGGEGQKIALARARYRNAPVIILDEPTASLDPIAEYEIYKNFDAIVGTKTACYISHRLSSCRFCDRIAVFHEGELVEEGHHDYLVAVSGSRYHQLWHAQAGYYGG